MRDLIAAAERKDYPAVLEGLKGMLSGIEWSEDAPPSALLVRDADIQSAITDALCARMMWLDQDYHHRLLLERLKALGGDEGAEARKDDIVEAGGITGSVELGLDPQ